MPKSKPISLRLDPDLLEGLAKVLRDNPLVSQSLFLGFALDGALDMARERPQELAACLTNYARHRQMKRDQAGRVHLAELAHDHQQRQRRR